MESGLIIAITAGLLAMLGWGTSDFFAKKSVDKVGHVASIFWMQTLGIIPLLFLLPFKKTWSSLSIETIILVTFFAAIDAAGYLMFYKALEKGKVSIIGPIVASYSAFSVLIAALFLGENLSAQTITVLAIIFIGILIVSTDLEEIKKNGLKKQDFVKGLPEALLGVLFFSIWFPFWDSFVAGKDWLVLVLILRVLMSIMLLFYSKSINETLKVTNRTVLGWLALVGILDVVAYLSLTWGYISTTHTSIIIMLSSTFSIPTLMLARVFLKERLQKAQIAGIILILAGIAFLAFI